MFLQDRHICRENGSPRAATRQVAANEGNTEGNVADRRVTRGNVTERCRFCGGNNVQRSLGNTQVTSRPPGNVTLLYRRRVSSKPARCAGWPRSYGAVVRGLRSHLARSPSRRVARASRGRGPCTAHAARGATAARRRPRGPPGVSGEPERVPGPPAGTHGPARPVT